MGDSLSYGLQFQWYCDSDGVEVVEIRTLLGNKRNKSLANQMSRELNKRSSMRQLVWLSRVFWLLQMMTSSTQPLFSLLATSMLSSLRLLTRPVRTAGGWTLVEPLWNDPPYGLFFLLRPYWWCLWYVFLQRWHASEVGPEICVRVSKVTLFPAISES